jgi:hypothetical protein
MKDIFVKAGENYEQKVGKCTRFSLVVALLTPRPSAEAENRPKSAHRYNVAEQQVIYKSEVERIWKAQFDSLSRKDEPQLTEEEKEEDVPKARQPSVRQETVPPEMSPVAGPSSPASPAFSRGSSLERDREMSMGPESTRRVLRIKRLVCSRHQGYARQEGTKPRLTILHRSLASGKLKSSVIPLLFVHMSGGAKRSKKSRPWQIRLHPLAMPIKIRGPRSGKFSFSREH